MGVEYLVVVGSIPKHTFGGFLKWEVPVPLNHRFMDPPFFRIIADNNGASLRSLSMQKGGAIRLELCFSGIPFMAIT